MNRFINRIFFFVIVLWSFVLITTYFLFPVVGRDTGFYLAVARELYSGKIYFTEIGIAYNPLSIIVFGSPFLFSDNPSYYWHLIINFIIIFGSAFVLLRILKKVSKNKNINLTAATFFILISLMLEGRYVLLEPLSVFFQLLALYYYLAFRVSKKLLVVFFVGLFISLAFLSKQYGLFIALPIGLDLVLRKQSVSKNLFAIAFGFLVPLSVFYFYLGLYETSLIEYIRYILGIGFELDQGNGTGTGYDLYSYLIGYAIFIIFNLYLLVIPLMLIKTKKIYNDNSLFIVVFISSLLVLYFASYLHYFQYIIPYAIIVFVTLYNQKISLNTQRVTTLLISISIFAIIGYSIISFGRKQNQNVIENKTKIELLSHVKNESHVYLDGISPSYYYLCNYKSIDLKNIGFTFPGYFYPRTILKYLDNGEYLVLSENRFKIYKEIVKDFNIKSVVIDSKKYIIIIK